MSPLDQATLRPVLLAVNDPVLALDVESGLAGAGYQVIHAPEDGLPEFGPTTPILAALDPEERWETAMPLYQHLQALGVPVILFTTSTRAASLPPEMQAARRIEKPFDSESFLALVASRAERGGSAPER